MAFQQESDFTVSLEAAADLSTHQYKLVKVTGAMQVNIATAATDFAVGVLQNKPSAVGQSATVQCAGISKLIAGAAVAAGDRVTADSTGRAVATTTAGNKVFGIALTATSAAGQIVSVLLVRDNVA